MPHNWCLLFAPYADLWQRRIPRNKAKSKSLAMRYFASACAMCAPARKDKSHERHANSWLRLYQIDENFFERTFAGLEVFEINPVLAEAPQQIRNTSLLTLGIKCINQGHA